MIEDKLMSQQDVWEYLGITRAGLYKLIKTDKKFPAAIKILSQKKWKLSDIEEYLEKKREEKEKKQSEIDALIQKKKELEEYIEKMRQEQEKK